MLPLLALLHAAQAAQTTYQVLVNDKLVIDFADGNPPCLPDDTAAITFPFTVKRQPYQVSTRCEDGAPSLQVTRWEWPDQQPLVTYQSTSLSEDGRAAVRYDDDRVEVRLHTTP